MKPRSLNFITGLTFVPGWSMLGIIFILLGILRIAFGQHWEFGGFILLGIAMTINFDGVKFDFRRGGFKSYTLIFGIFRIGKWRPISKFPHLSILRMTYNHGNRFGGLAPGSGIATVGGSSSSYEQYEVHILSHTHLTKILVQNCKTRAKAQGIAEEIAAYTGMEIVKYNPRSSRSHG